MFKFILIIIIKSLKIIKTFLKKFFNFSQIIIINLFNNIYILAILNKSKNTIIINKNFLNIYSKFIFINKKKVIKIIINIF